MQHIRHLFTGIYLIRWTLSIIKLFELSCGLFPIARTKISDAAGCPISAAFCAADVGDHDSHPQRQVPRSNSGKT